MQRDGGDDVLVDALEEVGEDVADGETERVHAVASLAAGVGDHEIDMGRRYFLGGNNEVALVFAVFVVDDNNEFTVTEALESFLDSVKLDVVHA